MILNTEFINTLTQKSKESPRLRMNYKTSWIIRCQRLAVFYNLEPASVFPDHRHLNTFTHLIDKVNIEIAFLGNDK